MNKCAFVIPLHPKHFDYGYYIFYHLIDKNVDLYFIFTDNEDKNLFLSKISRNEDKNKVNFLILADFVDIEIVKKTSSFVSVKKLFGLFKLYEKYDYISCIDSEIRFINNNNNNNNDYYNIMKNIVDTKVICSGKLNEYASEINIVYDSLTKLTDEIYHEDLKSLSLDYTLYTWWSNLPVYHCKIAEQFLKWIKFSNNNLERFCYNIFDDITYNFFCILFYDYQIKIIENCFHSLEFSDSNLVEKVDQTICKLYWVNNNAYNQNKIYYEKNNFQIVFHLDRWFHVKPLLLNNQYYENIFNEFFTNVNNFLKFLK
jgi:hypothetical protein